MKLYRCDWCGQIYSAERGKGAVCPNHITDLIERRREATKQRNQQVKRLTLVAVVTVVVSVAGLVVYTDQWIPFMVAMMVAVIARARL